MIEEGMGGRVNKHPYTTQLSAYYLASRPKPFFIFPCCQKRSMEVSEHAI
jgi:hypothetical protein